MQQYWVIHPKIGQNDCLLNIQSGARHCARFKAIPEKIQVAVGIESNPHGNLCDVHFAPYPIISSKLKDALAPLALPRLQFHPTYLESDGQGSTEPYFILHCFNRVDVLDLAASDLDTEEIAGDITVLDVRKLVFDQDKIQAVDPNDLQLFRLSMYTKAYVCNDQVCAVIKAANPTGVGIVRLEDYFSDIAWNDA